VIPYRYAGPADLAVTIRPGRLIGSPADFVCVFCGADLPV
jgi:hypothetical protein